MDSGLQDPADLFFFFQAEDGIRVVAVTGVQTCALPISQAGTLRHAPAAVHKEAYAFNLGARYLGFFDRKLWIEAALARRSGDRRAGDDHDQAFQSYENVNRFLILESSEFGLDVDTNVTSTRLTVGVGPFDVS